MKRTFSTLIILALSYSAFAAEEKKPADNTGKNERDRSGETLTPGDQSNSPEDLKLTQAIRKAVVKDESLTMTAKNIKIITANAMVTLRGPVLDSHEKTRIDKLARTAAPGAKVDNQLEIKPAS